MPLLDKLPYALAFSNELALIASNEFPWIYNTDESATAAETALRLAIDAVAVTSIVLIVLKSHLRRQARGALGTTLCVAVVTIVLSFLLPPVLLLALQRGMRQRTALQRDVASVALVAVLITTEVAAVQAVERQLR